MTETRTNLIVEFPAMYHRVKYLGGDLAYETDKPYYVHYQKLSDGRVAIFKSSHHYSEDSGYKVYPSMEELNNEFIELL